MNDELCRNLKLTIRRVNNDAQVQLFLRDDLNLREIELLCDINLYEVNQSQRRYYLREAVIIGMRRLVAKAITEGLISDYPGEYTTSSAGITRPPGPSITSMTDEDSL
jgi:hypothetical protein